MLEVHEELPYLQCETNIVDVSKHFFEHTFSILIFFCNISDKLVTDLFEYVDLEDETNYLDHDNR